MTNNKLKLLSCFILLFSVFINAYAIEATVSTTDFSNPLSRGLELSEDDEDFLLRGEPSTTKVNPYEYSNKHLLLITVSDYDDGWSKLKGVKEDRQSLLSKFGKTGLNYHITEISGEDAYTTENIKRLVSKFIDEHGQDPNNQLIIYYAGHGFTKEVNGTDVGYLVPASAPHPSRYPELFELEALEIKFFAEQAKLAKSKHVMFVFDSCFSGSVFRAMRSSGKLGANIKSLMSQPVRLFIASGSKNQEVPDESIFRRRFEEALNGAADLFKDGYIVGTELALYLREHVTLASEGKQTPQFAKMPPDFVEGDIVFPSPLGIPQRANPTSQADTLKHQVALRSFEPGVEVDPRCTEQGLQCPQFMRVNKGTTNFTENGQTKSFALSQDLWVGRYEISVAQWNDCFARGGCTRWLANEDQLGHHPISNVSWQDAQEYITWLNLITANKTGTYRLPSVNEWQYFARAGNHTQTHWSDPNAQNKASCRGCLGIGNGKLQPVGSFDANHFGLYDVVGNLWEWTACLPMDKGTCTSSLLMGGSFGTDKAHSHLAAKTVYPANQSRPNFGFRVVRELQK